MGVKANLRISEETKDLFPAFSGFSSYSSDPTKKGEKGRRRAKKPDLQEGRPDTP